jgi:hypothetical protein
VRGAFLLGLVFYKICTKIIHKLYVELRSGLVCMECREPCHNRHAVSLLADHTRGSCRRQSEREGHDVQALDLVW